MGEPTYCLLWNEDLREAIEIITPDQARKRDEKARAGKDVDDYTVVFGHPALPDAYIEVVWENNYLAVRFPDADGRPTMTWGFRKTGDQMFLSDMTHWLYPEGARPDYRDALVINSYTYKPDGYSKQLFNNTEIGRTRMIERKDVSLEGFWAPVPTFDELTYEWIPEWIREAGKDIRSKGALTRDEIFDYAPED